MYVCMFAVLGYSSELLLIEEQKQTNAVYCCMFAVLGCPSELLLREEQNQTPKVTFPSKENNVFFVSCIFRLFSSVRRSPFRPLAVHRSPDPCGSAARLDGPHGGGRDRANCWSSSVRLPHGQIQHQGETRHVSCPIRLVLNGH